MLFLGIMIGVWIGVPVGILIVGMIGPRQDEKRDAREMQAFLARHYGSARNGDPVVDTETAETPATKRRHA